MKIIVTDTNVFIDLYTADLLDAFFSLPWEVHTTDFVMLELRKNNQRDVVMEFAKSGQLNIHTQTGEEIHKMIELMNTGKMSSNLSITDYSVLMLADKLQGSLLTGDARLCAQAKLENIEVHGILYVFDQLVNAEVVSKNIAARALEYLSLENPRLPKEIVSEMISKWEKGGPRCKK